MEKTVFEETKETDKEKFVKKHGLINENNAWYEHGENSHKHLIFKDEFYDKSDIIELLFRFNKLCIAKVKYFRKNIHKYEPLKYHYKNGFITVPLWDADFLRHKASGYILDFKYLQTITVYDDFVSLYKELEEYEKGYDNERKQ
jgi:hypothetical protein